MKYLFIVSPDNNKHVSIFSSRGKSILKKYLKNLIAGAFTVHAADEHRTKEKQLQGITNSALSPKSVNLSAKYQYERKISKLQKKIEVLQKELDTIRNDNHKKKTIKKIIDNYTDEIELYEDKVEKIETTHNSSPESTFSGSSSSMSLPDLNNSPPYDPNRETSSPPIAIPGNEPKGITKNTLNRAESSRTPSPPTIYINEDLYQDNDECLPPNCHVMGGGELN